MDVLIFGDSGVGKSSNIVAAYAGLKDAVIGEGFLSRCRISVEPDEEVEMWYRDYWRSGQYPAPTVRQCNHTFSIWYGVFFKKNLFRISIIDTVGGHSVEVDDEGFHDSFISTVCESDDLMAFFSCRQLLPDNDRDLSIMGRKIDLLLEAINMRLESSRRSFRLTLVFTMSDLISQREREEISQLFEGLISDDVGRLVDVNHFFVSNNPHNLDSPELPLLSLIAHSFMRMADDSRNRRSGYGFRQRWVIRRATHALLTHMEGKTTGGMWRMYKHGLEL